MEMIRVVAVQVFREVLLEQFSSHIGPKERDSPEHRESKKEQVFEKHRFYFLIVVIIILTQT